MQSNVCMVYGVYRLIFKMLLFYYFVQQLYNLFPRLFSWLRDRKELMKSASLNRRDIRESIKALEDTLNPQMCRGLVDSFLARKKQLEVHKTLSTVKFV